MGKQMTFAFLLLPRKAPTEPNCWSGEGIHSQRSSEEIKKRGKILGMAYQKVPVGYDGGPWDYWA